MTNRQQASKSNCVRFCKHVSSIRLTHIVSIKWKVLRTRLPVTSSDTPCLKIDSYIKWPGKPGSLTFSPSVDLAALETSALSLAWFGRAGCWMLMLQIQNNSNLFIYTSFTTRTNPGAGSHLCTVLGLDSLGAIRCPFLAGLVRAKFKPTGAIGPTNAHEDPQSIEWHQTKKWETHRNFMTCWSIRFQ